MTRLFSLVAVAAWLMPSVVAQADTLTSLRVRLLPEARQPSDVLTGPAWAALLKECQRIWRDEQVNIIDTDGTIAADVSIPVLFDHSELLKSDSPEGRAFGLTRFRGVTRQIVLSVPRAREAAYRDPSLAASGFASAGVLDSTAARILGRVVAHEVGHVLLLSPGHGKNGLMRPKVDVGELRSGSRAQFALSSGERARLAALFPDLFGRRRQRSDESAGTK